MKTPVLLLIFSRFDFAESLLASVREARPERLYIAADGPRPHREGEAELCQKTRKVSGMVDWPCEVHTLFRDENLGPGRAISEAITWFFEQEAEGIVLEEDCLPTLQFFEFCEEMLERYRDNPRIAQIGGRNNLPLSMWRPDEYFFNTVCTSWGWASWRRYWLHQYDPAISSWPDFRHSGRFRKNAGIPEERRYWSRAFDRLKAGEVDTWDYQILLSMWEHDLLSVRPGVNLVRNVGFGDRATNTTDANHPEARVPFGELQFPIKHPVRISVDRKRDWLIRRSYLRPKARTRNETFFRIWRTVTTGLLFRNSLVF
jgi:hypothetical protein